jgi:hypothetical protein
LKINKARMRFSRKSITWSALPVQQVETVAFEDTVAGRRVVISSDGGRLRLRETKRGPKTKKGRQRYTGAWREPKVLIVYAVDAEGKREASFAPVIDATLQGPDAVFALLRTYLQRLAITQQFPEVDKPQ